jgi:sugar phosphate isomerase/epimerase
MMLDLYHAQIGEGNLIELLERANPFIGEVQVADVSDRCEPGTGEISFSAIAAALDRIGYHGTIGLEAYACRGRKLAIVDDAHIRGHRHVSWLFGMVQHHSDMSKICARTTTKIFCYHGLCHRPR